jgi:hypothetical protein
MNPVYQYDQQPGTRFTEEAQEIINKMRDSEYSVLVGRNNCGKSFILKHLAQHWGENCSYVGPARYQNFNLLGYFTPNRDRKNQRWRELWSHLQQQQHLNIDNSPVNLQQAIAELSDDQRGQLAEIIKAILGVDLQIRHTAPNNSMSQQYIAGNGHNISYTSSGFRLIMTLVTCLLDSEYDTYLIDEPELGISPEAQGILADFLFNRELRARYFPHVRTIVFATHSTIFLDRLKINNNLIVEKNGDEISISPVSTQAQFNGIHFFLLGNRFETLFLPSAIVLVEGKCDHKFIERVLTLRYPGQMLSVIPAHSDSRIKEILNLAKGIFSDLQKSPYRDRIFVVLDSVHSAGLPKELIAMGVPNAHIIVWPKNGIEYYYPEAILDRIFGSGGEIEIRGDLVSKHGIERNKNELATMVVSMLDATTPLSPHFQTLFIDPLEAAIR